MCRSSEHVLESAVEDLTKQMQSVVLRQGEIKKGCEAFDARLTGFENVLNARFNVIEMMLQRLVESDLARSEPEVGPGKQERLSLELQNSPPVTQVRSGDYIALSNHSDAHPLVPDHSSFLSHEPSQSPLPHALPTMHTHSKAFSAQESATLEYQMRQRRWDDVSANDQVSSYLAAVPVNGDKEHGGKRAGPARDLNAFATPSARIEGGSDSLNKKWLSNKSSDAHGSRSSKMSSNQSPSPQSALAFVNATSWDSDSTLPLDSAAAQHPPAHVDFTSLGPEYVEKTFHERSNDIKRHTYA